MLTQSVGWPTLQHRHFVTRLTFFYKIIHGTVPLILPSYFIPTQYPIQDNIMASILLSLVTPLQHTSRVFIQGLLENGTTYR